MWTDNETTIDLLGFKVHADLIRKVVTNPTLLPITFGVFGDWGGGKTSIMKMLQHDLDSTNWNPLTDEAKEYQNVVCLYFNSWLFEGYDDAKAAILSSVLLQLSEHKRLGPTIRDKALELLKSVNWMRVARLGIQHIALPGIAAYLSGGLSLIPAVVLAAKRLWAGNSEEGTGAEKKDAAGAINWSELVSDEKSAAGSQTIRSFRSAFATLLKDSNIKSLVILIDDLDRCSPERIIENLEAIKLFLNVDNTAFVIGADPRIVRHAVAYRYKPKTESDAQQEENEKLITDYIEKLIQVPYRLPRLSPAETHTYMSLLFCQRHLTDQRLADCLTAAEALRQQNRYSAFGYLNIQAVFKDEACPEELSNAISFCASAAPLITEGLKGNPRQVKRFLNAFILRKELATVAKLTHIRNDVLIKLMILEYTSPRQFLQLYDWQVAQDGCPEQLIQLESTKEESKSGDDNDAGDSSAKNVGADWTTKSIRRWIQMAPSLAGEDLRDYFWIARDRLELSFNGVTMVPPIVSRVHNDLCSNVPSKQRQASQMAQQLTSEEADALLTLVQQRIQRQPEQKEPYDVLLKLVEVRLEGASARLSQILLNQSLDQIPAAVGSTIKVLLKGQPGLNEQLKAALERVRESSTRFGRALQDTPRERRP